MTAHVPQLKARYQPQERIDDFFDLPIGRPSEFDAAPVLLGLDADGFRRLDAEIRRMGRRDLADLAHRAGVDIRADGPYEVVVDRADYALWVAAMGLDPSRIAGLDDAELAAIRTLFGVEAAAPAAPGPSAP